MASAPASKMKRMLLGPAFCLDKVAEAPKEDPLVNAAECQPMSLITENLLLGSWRDATDHATLRAAGVTHVLNVAREVVSVTEAERAALLEGDFQHLSLPMADSHSEDIHRHFDEAFAFIDGARAAPAGRVLVHCRRGISRSAAIVVAYLMREQQCDYAEALRFVEARRRVSLNLAFRELLEHYRPSPACGSVGSCRAIASGATAAVAAAGSSTSSAHHANHHNCACGGVASGDGDATFDSDSEARAIGGAAVGGGGFGDENDDPVSPPKVGAGVGSGTGTTAGMSRGVSSVEEDFASQDAAPASSSHTRRPFVVDT